MSRWRGAARIVLRKVLPVVFGLCVLVVLISWLAGSFKTKIKPGRVEIQQAKWTGQPTDIVHEVTKDYIEEAVGTLRASSRTEISSKVIATIDEIKVRAGNFVKQDDVLILLNNEELQSRVKQAEEASRGSTAKHTLSKSDLKRAEELYKGKAIPKSKFDEVVTATKVARAEEARAKQALNEAKIVLSYATIKAPKSGLVVDRFAEPGDTANPGQPLLVIYNANSLRLETPVVEKLAIKLREGQRLTVHVDAIDRDVEATIAEIVPQADTPSRSFLVKVTLPRTDDLYEGMFGRLLIPAGQRNHLCLSIDAIQVIGQLQFVEVVRDDNTLERRLIRTGRVGLPGRVEVLSGLKSDERVVLRSNPSQSQ